MAQISDIVTTNRASTGTYFDTNGVMQDAANNVWRMDHDPVTGAPRGVRIEEQRTNLLLHSGDLSQGAWVKVRSSVSAGPTLRGIPLWNFVPNTVETTSHILSQTVTFAALASDTVFSTQFIAKANGTSTTRLAARVSDTVGFRVYVFFDLMTGQITAGQGDVSVHSAAIVPVGDGMFRIELAYVARATSTYARIEIYASSPTANSTTQTNFNGTDGYLIGAAQIEQANFPTSYIPTTTAEATRAADLNFTNDVSWVNGAENSFVFDFDCPDLDNQSSGGGANARRHLIGFQTVGSNNVLYVFLQPWPNRLAQLSFVVTNAGSTTTHSLGIADITEGRHKIAISLYPGEARASVDGGAIRSVTGVQTIPWAALNRVYFGSQIAARFLNGHMRMAASYPRVLSDAELQAASVLS